MEYAWYICYISGGLLYHLRRLILQYVIINISNIVTIINTVIINHASCFLEQPSEIQYSLESCLGIRQKTSSEYQPLKMCSLVEST